MTELSRFRATAAIKAGALNRRVSVQANAPTQNGKGELVDNWATITNGMRSAAVEPLLGREYFAAAQRGAEATLRVRLRYLPGVLPTMRIVFGARIFDILHVADVNEAHVETVCLCKERF